MTIEEFADYIKEKFSLTDEELIKYCDLILNGLKVLAQK